MQEFNQLSNPNTSLGGGGEELCRDFLKVTLIRNQTTIIQLTCSVPGSVLSRELQVFSRGRRGRAVTVTTGTHFQRLLNEPNFI